MTAKDLARRTKNTRLAALVRWSREHARVLRALLWALTLALPPVVVALPATAQAIIAVYLAAVPFSLGITWRMYDRRKHERHRRDS